jgi:hypothetical protein
MAIITAINASPTRPAVTSDDSEVVAVRGEHVLTAPLAAGDVIQMVKLPIGTKIVDVMLDSSAAIGAATVGEAGGAFVAIATNAVTAVGAGVDRLDDAAAMAVAPATVEQMVVVTATAGGGLAGDVVGLTVSYRNQRHGG